MTVLLEIILLMFLTLPENALLRDAKGNLEPFFQGMVVLMSLGFLLPAVAYGLAAGTIKSNRDVGRMIDETLGTMGSYIALAFAASQFVAYFAWSNLGLILAVTGADMLRASGLTGIPLIILFVFVCAAIDLFVASASAKWAVVGPIFVPMLMIMGYSPEVTQAAYRIGDSFTNIITPLMPYMPLVIAFAQKYQPRIGLGTLLTLMLPYSSRLCHRLDHPAGALAVCWESHWVRAPAWSIRRRDRLRVEPPSHIVIANRTFCEENSFLDSPRCRIHFW